MRAFIALEPDPSAQAALQACLRRLRQAADARDVKWVSEDNLHLTLRFLGVIDPAQKDRLIELLKSQLPALGAAHSLRMSEPRLFPRPAQARVIACMIEPDAWLSQLAGACERCAQAIGLPSERRPFHSHITLGRTRPTFQWRVFEAWPATWTALMPARVTLFKSILAPRGPTYEALTHIHV
jgi:2'-5' RNA ligase